MSGTYRFIMSQISFLSPDPVSNHLRNKALTQTSGLASSFLEVALRTCLQCEKAHVQTSQNPTILIEFSVWKTFTGAICLLQVNAGTRNQFGNVLQM